jgi:class 3 adenylate cyclase
MSITSASDHPVRKKVILFVDMVNSTELKYRFGPDVVFDMIASLYQIVRDVGWHSTPKFTGDGAMVVLDPADRGCERAAWGALEIMSGVESLNLSFRFPSMQVRIGIATGDCLEFLLGVDDVTGKAPDLAARLCAEADRDEILIDEPTYQELAESSTPLRFEKCGRRLSLKGIPAAQVERFYTLKSRRLVSTSHAVLGMAGGAGNAGGLVAIYPDRDALEDDFRPARIVRRAAPRSEVVVAGRTLITWARTVREMLAAMRDNNVTFRFLLSHPDRMVLDPRQRREIADDFPQALDAFRYLTREHGHSFVVRVTRHLLLDGVTCATLTQPRAFPRWALPRSPNPSVFVALQDVNAAPGAAKAALLFGCTCRLDAQTESSENCMAHGLHKRTALLLEDEDSVDVRHF